MTEEEIGRLNEEYQERSYECMGGKHEECQPTCSCPCHGERRDQGKRADSYKHLGGPHQGGA